MQDYHRKARAFVLDLGFSSSAPDQSKQQSFASHYECSMKLFPKPPGKFSRPHPLLWLRMHLRTSCMLASSNEEISITL